MNVVKKIVTAGALVGLLLLSTPSADAQNNCVPIVDDITVDNFNIVLSQLNSCTPVDTTAESYSSYKATLDSYEAAYKKFSLAEKREVIGYEQLTEKVKQANAVQAVTKALDELKVSTSASTFANTISRIRANYIALPEADRQYVYNASMIGDMEQVVDVMQKIAEIKVSDLPAVYKEKIKTARNAWLALPEELRKWVGNEKTLLNQEATLDGVLKLEALLEIIRSRDVANLTDDQVKAFLRELTVARETYDKLPVISQKLVEGFDIVPQYEKALATSLKVTALINAINPYDRSFYTKTTAALKAYERLSEVDRRFVQNYQTLESYLEPAAITNELSRLRTTSKTYTEDVAKLRSRYEALTALQQEYVSNRDLLLDAEAKVIAAKEVEKLINEIPSAPIEGFIAAVNTASAAYKALDSGQRKLVANYAELRVFEKTVKNVERVEVLIDKIDVTSSKFTSLTIAAQRAYDRLLPTEKMYVKNKDILTSFGPVSDFLTTLTKLRTTSKTYREDVSALRQQYSAFDATLKQFVDNYEALPKIQAAEKMIQEADYLVNKISKVGEEPEEYYIARVAEIRTYYNDMSRDAQKLVTNYKQLQAIEREIKPILTTALLINDMTDNPKSLMAAFDKAQKSYARLQPDQKKLVYNFHIFEQYEQAVTVSRKIKALKPSNRYFLTDLSSAQAMYDGLDEEKKKMVEGAGKLIEAQMEMKDVGQIVNNIQRLSVSSPNYVKEVRTAEEGYKQLSSAYRKLVTNYNHLKDALKEVKQIERVIKAIDDLDGLPANKLASKIKSARKAYDKLDDHTAKPHVSNYMKLVEYETN